LLTYLIIYFGSFTFAASSTPRAAIKHVLKASIHGQSPYSYAVLYVVPPALHSSWIYACT